MLSTSHLLTLVAILALVPTAVLARQVPSPSTPAVVTEKVQRILSGEPMHLVLTSIAPKHGIAAGLAFVLSRPTTAGWQVRWTSDAVVSGTAAWRVGTYLQLRAHADAEDSDSSAPPPPFGLPPPGRSPGAPGINVYAQTTFVNRLSFYGLGPATSITDWTIFGMRQTVVGAAGVLPIAPISMRPLHLALTGELNGRFIDLHSGDREVAPSVEDRFTDAEAPGLDEQTSYLQFGEGLRLTPALARGRLQLGYALSFDQFRARDAGWSFHRTTVDLTHDWRLHPKPVKRMAPWGTARFRFVTSSAVAADGATIPFYLQQTLGGSDIAGDRGLFSYRDYRFRAPSLMVFQESFEHSLLGPLGFLVQFDQGAVAFDRSGLTGQGSKQSVTVGAIVRGDGLPATGLAVGFGGAEGTHIFVGMNVSFGAGPVRPRLD